MSSQIVSLDSLTVSPSPRRGGCVSSSCGTSSRPTDVDPATWERIKDHPCYSEEAHHYFARMHVAVAPACNIQCNYCNRKYDCSNESPARRREPERLTPEQAVKKVVAVASRRSRRLTVLGIAGPGDALAQSGRRPSTPSACGAGARRSRHQASASRPTAWRCRDHGRRDLPRWQHRPRHHHHQYAVDPADRREKIYPWIFWDHQAT